MNSGQVRLSPRRNRVSERLAALRRERARFLFALFLALPGNGIGPIVAVAANPHPRPLSFAEAGLG